MATKKRISRDSISTLLEQLEARETLREKQSELLRAADRLRAEIGRKEQEASVVDTEQQAAEDRARAASVIGDVEEAGEVRGEADTLAGQLHGLGEELRELQSRLAGVQSEVAEVVGDIKALDAARDEIHRSMTLQDTLAPWQAHKEAIGVAVLKALRANWPQLEAEARRLVPVLHDRRRVDQATWTSGRDGGLDIWKIVRDAAGDAVSTYLQTHTIKRLPEPRVALLGQKKAW